MSVKVAMVGTGYVGLVTGACFAELGHHVTCIDIDRNKIEKIHSGILPIYEAGLDDLVKRNVEQGRLHFTSDIAEGVKSRDAVFIAVGTPSESDGRADLRYVLEAAGNIADNIDQFTVVVTKSTVPVGTNRRVHATMLSHLGSDDLFAVASNPEFLREGAAIHDFMEPDRIVIGCDDPRADTVMRRIYAPLTSREVPLLATNIETAEMIKYAANAFLAIKVSFINEIADLCEPIGADVRAVSQGIGMDQRIGSSFLRAGPGWGGSCFPKDTRALLMTAKDLGMPARIVEAALNANTQRKLSMVDRVRAACDGSLAGKKIAVLGVTFKGQTDDMRESPSLDILPALIAKGATVVAFDPSEPHDAARLLPGVEMVGTALDAAKDADLLVVMTDWMIFKSYDLTKISSQMNRRVMLDLRNLYDRDAVLASKFDRYHGLGYGEKPSPTIDQKPALKAVG